MVEREADVAARHRQPLHRVEAGGIFGARAAQELAPRRDLVEQSFDADPGAGRKRRRPLARRVAVIDLDPPAVARRATRLSSVRRETLAIDGSASPRKPKLVDPVDRVAGQLGGRVALEREAHLVRAHAAAVVGDLDQLEPAGVKPHRNLPRAGVECVFDQLLERARRALDDLARGDAIDEFRRQPSY